MGWDRIPIGWQDFLDTWIPLGCRVYHTKLFRLTMVAWTLWTTRNKRTIEGKFPRKPADLLFKTNFFLQKWKPLLRKGDQAKIEVLVAQVKGWTEPFFGKVRTMTARRRLLLIHFPFVITSRRVLDDNLSLGVFSCFL